MLKQKFFIFGLFFGMFLPVFVFASVRINEIMYDLKEGSDTGREWVEIFNSGSEVVDLTGWRFYEAETNHKINLFRETNTFLLPAGGYAIIADDPNKFLIDWSNFSGVVLDSSFSLSNTGETITLRNGELVDIDNVTYSSGWGANGDGNSLQNVNGTWVAQAPTPGAANSGSSEPPPAQQPESQPSGSGSSAYIPPEKLPKISADAGADKTVVVGANVEFRGQAFGLKDEPLDNARYLWIFGDGASKDGKNITHIYQYPGEYIAALNVSSGEYSASDYMLVKALPNQVFISEIKTGADSFIEFENKSKQEIDISGCQIKYNNQTFIFPQSTAIRPNAYLAIPSSISGMVFNSGKGIIEFLYSGGFKADVFNYDGILKDGQSFNRDGKSSFVGALTPGGKNSSGVSNFLSADKNPQPNAKEQKTEAQKADSEKLSKEGARQGDGINADAGAGAINLTSSKGSSKTYFIIVILAVIIFGAAAILFIRRQRGV